MKIASAIATLALLSLPATGTTPVEGRTASRGLDGGVPAELTSYIESVSARFAIKDRETDVFGRYQDPASAPALAQKVVIADPIRPLFHPVQIPFPEVVKAIEVNTLIPAKKQFLVGSRKFSVGSVLPIRLPSGGKTVKAQVMDVTANTISFRNQDSGETVILKMEALPEGMIRGGGAIPAPGSPNAPHEIKITPAPGPVDRIIRPDHPSNFIADSRPSK